MMASTSKDDATGPSLSPDRHRPVVVLVACGSFNPPTIMHLRMFELARDYLHRRTNYHVREGIISVVNDAYKKKDLASAEHRLAMVRRALETSKWIRADDWEARQTQYCRTVRVLRHIRSVYQQRIQGKSVSTGDNEEREVTSSSVKRARIDCTQSSTESSGLGSVVTDNQSTPAACGSLASASTASQADEPQGEERSLRVMLLCGSDLLQSFEVPDLWDPADIEEIVRDFGIVVVSRYGHDPREVVYESDVLSKYEKNIHFVTEWISNDVSSTKIRRALKRSESVRYFVPDRVLEYINEHNLYDCNQRHTDQLAGRSSSLGSDHSREAGLSGREKEEDEPHCSYHPAYNRNRKSVDDSDYDNLAPCPCPLTTSASAPNALASELLPSARRGPRLATHPQGLSLDLAPLLQSSSIRPIKFPTSSSMDPGGNTGPLSDGYRGTIRPPTLKSALRSPPITCTRQRAVSYHSDLSQSSITTRQQALRSSRTMDMGESEKGQQLPHGSVSLQQRSLSDLAEFPFPDQNGSQTPEKESGQESAIVEKEEIAWHYNPEVTKSLPNLVRLHKQTPPRHVRILDKGVCFTPEDRHEEVESDTSSVANNLVVKIKQLKLTSSPETTV